MKTKQLSGQILNRWKDYFCTILNTDTDVSLDKHRLQLALTDNQSNIVIQALTYREVCSIINKLKCNKAGRTDNIIPELIKYGGRTLRQRIYKPITMIWEKEQLPNQWNEGIICPLYKKGDRLDCKNYRLITLLNVAYKIFAIILNQRLGDFTEAILGDYQSVFRPNRSTIDNIFMARQFIEKCHEYNVDIYNIFIDYTHAFNSIIKNKILDYLSMNKIPSKLANLIKLTFENTTAKVKVKVNNAFMSDFRVDCGVKQGDLLSPTLFNLVIDTVLKQLDLRGNTST